MRTRAVFILIACLTEAAGCGSPSSEPCTPGWTRPCSCSGTGQGTQTCQPSKLWSSCAGCSRDAGQADQNPTGTEGGPCGLGYTCGRDLVCRLIDNRCVRATSDAGREGPRLDLRLTADLPLPPTPDATQPDLPKKKDAQPPLPCSTSALHDGTLAVGASATATKGTQWLTIKLKDVDIAGISILTDWINPQKTTTDYVLGLGQLYTDSGATGFHVMVTAISVAPPTARLCITPP